MKTIRPGLTQIALSLAALMLLSALTVAAQDLKLELTPSTIPAGRTRTVKIKANPEADLTGLELQKPPDVSGVSFEDPGPQFVDGKRAIMARVTVDQDADEQILPLTVVKKKDGKVVESYTVDLTVSAFAPKVMQKQPTPAGLKFEVDGMVQPMSYKGAKDVFGRRVADHYYAVVLGLGNNTGYDLQINKIGFRTTRTIEVPVYKNGELMLEADGKPQMRRELMAITAIDRSLVRSSIERDQNFGIRALALNLIGGVGTLTTGFLPFFHALGPRANFSSFSSVLNGNLKDGFTMAVPDLTIRHLSRLDNSLVMDQDFMLPNNSERNTVVFVPRKALGLEGKDRDNLLKIRETLGELLIVGQRINLYENRQIVVRSDRPSQEPEPFSTPFAPKQGPISVDEVNPNAAPLSDSTDVVITGNGFLPGTAVKVKFGDRQTTGVVLTSTTIQATVPPNVKAAEIDVEVIAGDQQDKLEKGYAYVDELKIEAVDPLTGASGKTIKITGKGFLSGAKVTFGDKVATDVMVSNDHNTMTVTLPAQTPSAPVEVKVKNKNGKSAAAPKSFTYTQ